MSIIWLQISSLIYIVILNVFYFSKKRISNIENKIYKHLIISNIIGLVIEIICYFSLYYSENIQIYSVIITRALLVYYLWFITLYTYYVFAICYLDKKTTKFFDTVKIFSFIIFVINSIIICLLPMQYHTNNHEIYSYGTAVNYLTFILVLVMTFWFVLISKNFKKETIKKIYPVILFILLAGVAGIIQNIYPSLLLTTPIETIIVFLMYFTIENPDMKMIEQLEYARNVAEKANRAKSDFLSSMSHEIRTPLNAIVGFSEAVKTSSSLEEAVENAEDIITASQTLLEIVNGVLDISKIESGKLEIINSNYNALELFTSVSKLIQHKIDEKALDFQINIAPDLPQTLYGDHANIKKIVSNILSNAAKYTDKGYVKYSVNCVVRNNICRLIISVEDSGRGIKEEQIGVLFNKFQRLDEDRNTTIEGTGLGLAITKQLVDMMHGDIVVQSKYGEGSKFTVTLDQRISINPNETTEDLTYLKEELDIKDKKVLIVDDNVLNLKVAKKVLSKYTENVELVESGFACLDKLKENSYDLILLDDMMPKMSGKETLVKIKELGINTPVVALTANAISGEREKYISLGFKDYISKPIDKKELDEMLKKTFGNNKTENNEKPKTESKFKDIPYDQIKDMEDTIIVIKD